VFSREPLSGVPIEDDLLTLCREQQTACPWRPNTEAWTAIQDQQNEPVKIARNEKWGKAQTSSERQAATRGIGLNRDDPEPSLIMLTGSTANNILVVSVSLTHMNVAATNSSDEESELPGVK
jgi:hypothetical protein